MPALIGWVGWGHEHERGTELVTQHARGTGTEGTEGEGRRDEVALMEGRDWRSAASARLTPGLVPAIDVVFVRLRLVVPEQ